MEAARFLLAGDTQSAVARRFGVSRTTASRWDHALRRRGLESLKKRKATGRPSRLTPAQMAALPALMAQGASAFGYADGRWTTARLSRAIMLSFGVRYDPDHVGRLLHRLDLHSRSTPQEIPLEMAAAYGAQSTPRAALM